MSDFCPFLFVCIVCCVYAHVHVCCYFSVAISMYKYLSWMRTLSTKQFPGLLIAFTMYMKKIKAKRHTADSCFELVGSHQHSLLWDPHGFTRLCCLFSAIVWWSWRQRHWHKLLPRNCRMCKNALVVLQLHIRTC